MSEVGVLYAFQPIFFNETHRFVLVKGGRGSGKSHTAAQRVIFRCLSEANHKYLVTRKIARMLKDSVVSDITKILDELNEPYTQTISPPRIEFENGSQILFYGLDVPEKIKSVSGITSVWMEEGDQYRAKDFIEVDSILRSKSHHAEILITFNPVSKRSAIYQMFYAKKSFNKRSLYHESTYRDNPHAAPEWVESIEALKEVAPEKYEVYSLGHWGIQSGSIYRPLEQVANAPETYDRRYFGIDYGYTNPTGIVEVREHDGVYYLKQLMYARKQQHIDVAEFMQTYLNGSFDEVYIDPSSVGLIEMMAGMGINAKKGDNNVQAGIGYVKSIQANIRVEGEAIELIQEWDNYQYMTDKHGNELEVPLKMDDHICDAIRYALYSARNQSFSEYLGSF